MPWKETSPMEERMKFVLMHQEGWAATDLCEAFGVSRKWVTSLVILPLWQIFA